LQIYAIGSLSFLYSFGKLSVFSITVTCLVFVSTEVIAANVPLDYFESKGELFSTILLKVS